MIIVRSPLRITLGGGGTDLPSYYREHGGLLAAAAIDKYVYITVHEAFDNEHILKYSQFERVRRVQEIRHPIIREAMSLTGFDSNLPYLEITSMADVPAGTGLGSSGSFTTGLLKALHTYRKNLIHPQQLAEQACHIEIERLGDPIGKQDQYIAAYGGVTCFRFNKDDSVEAWPPGLASQVLYTLEENLLMFFTGYSRSAASILKDQDDRTKIVDGSMIDNLNYVKALGERSVAALIAGELSRFGKLMHEHWEHKRGRSRDISNTQIDTWYNLALENGAIGGKLIGAGGGGFLLFYAEDKIRLRRAMAGAGLREVRFRFDFEGTKVIAQ